MADILGLPVLVLNRYYQPVRVTTARRAFVLVYGGTAEAVDEHGDAYRFDDWRELPIRGQDDTLPVNGGALRVPRVVHLHHYERVPKVVVRLTRANLMLRDDYQCQYCGKRPASRAELNLDHVFPRSRGGPATWENLVTSCHGCNLRKGSRTPEEAHMRLRRAPQQPKWSASLRFSLGLAESDAGETHFPEWETYLRAG